MTDIIEGNRLIAEFDGYDIHMNGYQYHSSWDWLMPVVIKIQDYKGYKYLQNTISFLDIKHSNSDGSKLIKDIDTLWLAVVSFIKWHNQNK